MTLKKLTLVLIVLVLLGCSKSTLETFNHLRYDGSNVSMKAISDKLIYMDKTFRYSETLSPFGKLDWNKALMSFSAKHPTSVKFMIPLVMESGIVNGYVLSNVNFNKVIGNPEVYTVEDLKESKQKMVIEKNLKLFAKPITISPGKSLQISNKQMSTAPPIKDKLLSNNVPPGWCETSFNATFWVYNNQGHSVDHISFWEDVMTKLQISVQNAYGVNNVGVELSGAGLTVTAPMDVISQIGTTSFFEQYQIGFGTQWGTTREVQISNMTVSCGDTGGGGGDTPPPPPPACIDNVLNDYDINEDNYSLPDELTDVEINKRTLRHRTIIYRQEGMLEQFYFISNDISKHKKVNNEWVYDTFQHSSVTPDGGFSGGTLEYIERHPPVAEILNPKQAQIENFFSVELTVDCAGVPSKRIILNNGESRKYFTIND